MIAEMGEKLKKLFRPITISDCESLTVDAPRRMSSFRQQAPWPRVPQLQFRRTGHISGATQSATAERPA
jgi:hypothetical protein